MTKFDFATHEGIVAGELHDLEKTVLWFSLGSPPFNRKAMATAVVSWRALKITPSTAIMIHVGGYDEDPRELWQIPEAREFIGRFGQKTQAHHHPALEPMSRNLLLACGAEPDLKVHVDMITVEDSLNQSQEFFKSRLKEVP